LTRNTTPLLALLAARGDDEAEAGVGAVVAREGVVDLLGGEVLILGRGVRIGRTHAAPSAPSPREAGGRHAASPAGPSLTALLHRAARLDEGVVPYRHPVGSGDD
jgi:hypothetical protein